MKDLYKQILIILLEQNLWKVGESETLMIGKMKHNLERVEQGWQMSLVDYPLSAPVVNGDLGSLLRKVLRKSSIDYSDDLQS